MDLRHKLQTMAGNLENKFTKKQNSGASSNNINRTNGIPNFTNHPIRNTSNNTSHNTQSNQSANNKATDTANQNININTNTKQNNNNVGNSLLVPDAYSKYQEKYNQKHAKKGFLGNLKTQFKKAGTARQIDTSGANKFKNTIIDELGYKRLTNDRHHYLVLATPYRATRGYAEILQVGGASLSNLPPQVGDRILIGFINFLRSYMPDLTFVSIHLPNDSRAQQHFWAGEKRDINYRILQGGMSYHMQEVELARRKMINSGLKHFQDIDLSVDNQAFVMMLFGRTENELNRDVRYAFAFGKDVLKLSFMSKHQKETFLTRLNNPNIAMR